MNLETLFLLFLPDFYCKPLTVRLENFRKFQKITLKISHMISGTKNVSVFVMRNKYQILQVFFRDNY